MPDIVDTVIEDARWDEIGLEDLSQRSIRAALVHLEFDPDGFEICVLGCNDERIAELNSEFRKKTTATNVLSWPSQERGAQVPGGFPSRPEPGVPGQPLELGDIAIAFETCLKEADAAGKTPVDHVTHLIVHGLLHLLGYDHIDDKDAALMEHQETEILGKLGVADPYRA